MRRIVVLLLLFLLSMSGCRAASAHVSRKISSSRKGYWNWRADWKYRLDDARLRQMKFAGAVQVEDVNVSYPLGLDQQARCLADQIYGLVRHIEELTGLDVRLGTEVYLLRLDNIPSSYQMTFARDPNYFTMPLFVQAGQESCEAIVGKNVVYPAVFAHELVEVSLIFRKSPGAVLADIAGPVPLLGPRLLNYTRWFREGLANYAGHLAYVKLRGQIEAERPAGRSGMFSHPFSSLDSVGDRLFRWHQYSAERLDDEYYNAALGLFLLIHEEFGPDGVKRIVQGMHQQDYLNGRDLIRLVNETLDTDIERLAAEFQFPKTGLKTSELTKAVALDEGLQVESGLFVTAVEPNSPASGPDTAGFKDKDVIVAINDTPIRNSLDFELALFAASKDRAVNATIWRKDAGQMTLRLLLGEGEWQTQGRKSPTESVLSHQQQ